MSLTSSENGASSYPMWWRWNIFRKKDSLKTEHHHFCVKGGRIRKEKCGVSIFEPVIAQKDIFRLFHSTETSLALRKSNLNFVACWTIEDAQNQRMMRYWYRSVYRSPNKLLAACTTLRSSTSYLFVELSEPTTVLFVSRITPLQFSA